MAFKDELIQRFIERQQFEVAVKQNPSLAETPEAKKKYRHAGVVVTILGIGVAVAAWVSWDMVGRTLVIAIATPVVLVPSGIYMMITGKNPFQKKSRLWRTEVASVRRDRT